MAKPRFKRVPYIQNDFFGRTRTSYLWGVFDGGVLVAVALDPQNAWRNACCALKTVQNPVC